MLLGAAGLAAHACCGLHGLYNNSCVLLGGPCRPGTGLAFHLHHRTWLGQSFTLGLSGLGGNRLTGSSVMVRAPESVLPVLSTSAKGASVITPI